MYFCDRVAFMWKEGGGGQHFENENLPSLVESDQAPPLPHIWAASDL